MNILFLTLGRITDINERGIYTDLIRKFRDEGHHIYVVTPLERRFKKETCLTAQDGVSILGVKTLNIQKTNFAEKGIATLLVEHQYKRAIKKCWGDIKFELILYSTPPITLTSLIKDLREKYTAVTYLLLKDIFPQNAVDLKMFSRKSIWYKIFRRKEKLLYAVSDYIGCMSPANVEFLQKNNPYINPGKIEVNPNSIDVSENVTISDREEVRKRYGLPLDVPVLIYGGNLGKPQGIDFLIEILNRHSRMDCFLLIIGSGTEYNKLEKWFCTYRPVNAKLLKGLPKEEYDTLVRSCDAGLIFLDYRFTIPNYPSRLLSYLENKMPVIATTDVNTDIGKIAEENGYGYWCESDDVGAFNRCIDKLIADREKIKRMGRKGYDYLKSNYTVDVSYSIIMKHFNKNVS